MGHNRIGKYCLHLYSGTQCATEDKKVMEKYSDLNVLLQSPLFMYCGLLNSILHVIGDEDCVYSHCHCIQLPILI